MNIENAVSLNNGIKNDLNLIKEQNSFLNSFLGKTINTGLDIGLRAILPDFIEDQIINIKDNLLNYGLKEGITKSIDDAINLGKSAIGIVTGNFENVSQMEAVVKNGGLIDSISNVLDFALNQAHKKGAINSNISNIIKQGKNSILNSVENNIEKNIANQIKSSNSLDTYINNWKNYYNNKDFDNMEKQFKKIKKELKNLMPLEKSISEARTIENIHTLIKNNGHNFNLSETEMELINKLQ
ncbi:MAG: hypothetical protein IKF52_04175 [Clostridia bacterium]|nr:hypothetical protein [Clostridia bacterium]MBR3209631.1 hypothetical protein [Bacilli bacterium]